MKRRGLWLVLVFVLLVPGEGARAKTGDGASAEEAQKDPLLEITPRGAAEIITVPRWDGPDEEAVPEYVLGPEDIIGIAVERHPEFTGIIIIAKDGRIEFPLDADRTFRVLPEYKDLRPEGLTVTQLEEVITQKLKRYLYEPEVTVSMIEYGSQKYYVVGEVLRPGRYPLQGGTLKLQDAIFAAGLPTPYAALRRVRIISPDKEKPTFKRINLYALLYKGDLSQNVSLEPGDIVYVPSTVASKINSVLDQILNPASRADTLQRLYYQFDKEYNRWRSTYDEWYYKTRPPYGR